MYKRLFKGDHTHLAQSLNNLASLYQAQGKLSAAEPLCKEALEMKKRLFKGDHARLALSLNNLAGLYHAQGKLSAAEPLCKDALAMYKRLTTTYAQQKAEGETLTLASSLPLTRDAYLSVSRLRAADARSAYDPATAYPAVWATKGTVARVFEQRHLRARAAAVDP